jgi:glycosyltransferase involved in cell wall biosynthesis
VSLAGFVANPQAFMARAAVLAMSSIYEGLPTVITEALAVGATVVATDCESGPREILDGGRFGTLVPVGDREALARGILDALDSPRDGDLLRARADDYRVPRAAAQYLRVIEEVTASGASRGGGRGEPA